ncbi:MAG: hypothetical protein V4609_07510 [Pseudomonadota bacterium]
MLNGMAGSDPSLAKREKLSGLGVQVAWRDGAELAKSVQTESAVTGALVRELGLAAKAP